VIRTDLLVVGLGPAGCAAARAARSAVRDVRVLAVDAASFPRDKPCGGAIPGGGLRELAMAGLELRVAHDRVGYARLRAGGEEVRVALPAPAAVVERRAFDADLVRQVRAAGAQVIEGAPLLGIERGVARTGAGEIAFRALVVADGVSAAGRRALALPAGRRVPLREARAARAQGDLVFDLDVGVAGYAWRFPSAGESAGEESLGAYALAGGGVDATLRTWAAAEGLAATGREAWALRVRDRTEPTGVGPALLAGEALGADPLTAEGIRYALWSGRIAGRLAARALVAGRSPSPLAYRCALGCTRTGAVLALGVRLAPRLYGTDPRWRRAAAHPAVVAAFAALVSGEAVVPHVARLLLRYAGVRRTA
jgi:flavin-dependent dehydrogenase